MAPFSDVDLLFLTPYKQTAWGESLIESVLYCLWDLQLKVGHAIRTVDDCLRLARERHDHPHLAPGDTATSGATRALAATLRRAALDRAVRRHRAASSSTLKLAERAERHNRQGGQRYLLEPNVKEGKGGLRDLQTLFWIAKYLNRAETPDELVDARRLHARGVSRSSPRPRPSCGRRAVHLHLLTRPRHRAADLRHPGRDRARTRLRGDRGPARGRALHAGLLPPRQARRRPDPHLPRPALEARHVKPRAAASAGDPQRLRLRQGRRRRRLPASSTAASTSPTRRAFLADPVNILRLFEEALRTGTPIHPDALRLIAANLDLIDDALRARPARPTASSSTCCSSHDNPERALRRMNEVGVLGAFIPEFGRIVAMMQFNMYHHYTVDEHIIQCDLDPRPDRARRARRRAARRLRASSRRASTAGCSMWRSCSTTSARARAATTRASAPRSPRRLCPRLGLDAERGRTRRMAGAQPPADVRRGAEARPRRPAHGARLRRGGEEPDAAQAADRADRLRHPRRRPGRLEQLEGDAAARRSTARRSSS